MNAWNYTTPGDPLPGSVAWGAARIERLLEDEERRLKKALADRAAYPARFRSAPKQAANSDPHLHLVSGTDWTTGGAAVGGTLGAIGGGLLGGIGGGAACTFVAPGVGTVGCGAGGAAEGVVIGGSIGAGLGAAIGSGIDALTSDEEEDLEEFCGRAYAGDVEVCNMLARRRGKRKAAACFAAASARYANCLRGSPRPPLAGWDRRIDGF